MARLVYDTDTKPTDFDCYDTEDVQRWRSDEWFYVGVVLSVSRNGVELSDHAASLWGIDCNFNDKLDISRNQEFKGIMCAMKKRKELHQIAQTIINILEN